MPQRSVVAVGASLLVASLALAGCGTRGDSGDDASGSGSSENKVAKIGVIAPLSGDLAALGLGIKNSVDLAIKQANDSKAIPGWTLELAAEDDEAKPDVGKNAARIAQGEAPKALAPSAPAAQSTASMSPVSTDTTTEITMPTRITTAV